MPIWRFIPACAGNAISDAFKSSWIAVHPRVCGERMEYDLNIAKNACSSPRVRGTHIESRN